MPRVITKSIRSSLDEILAVLEDDGCIILEDVIGPEDLVLLQAELEPYWSRTPNSEGYFYGFDTKRMGGLIRKSAVCQKLAIHPQILGIMDHVLGPHCDKVQLNLTQAIRILPGEKQQIVHPDDPLFPFEHEGSECMINVLYAYDDFTVENGATWIAPGSHKWSRERHPEPHELTQAVMKRGSAVVYFGSVRHGGGANVSNRHRTGFVISYSLGWLRQVENQYLSVPPAVAKKLPEQLQDLLGYAMHAPNMGWVEGQSPKTVFDGLPDVLAHQDYMTPELQEMMERHYHGEEVAVA